ncbi:hypothetical protein DVH24_019237 [Malus domestica]|uniref:RRM domain-containing protein n=1 Tax=Malus domestica TaxID=3750 RepID=A0A498I0B3_MALDO|nr:hypothetical protein DVH24_019237 [Malus domestica]
MAMLRRLVHSNPKLSYSSSLLLPPALLISCRGIATKLFVGGLSFYTNEKGLSEAFSQYGQVIEAQIVSDRVSERSKGFGFVTFASEDEAHKALEEMNGKVIPCFLFSLIHLNLAILNNSKMTHSKHSQPLNGRVIFVDYAKPRTNYGSGMPIARGPPDSIKDGRLSKRKKLMSH